MAGDYHQLPGGSEGAEEIRRLVDDKVIAAGGGEANTGANVNVGGIGVFENKTGVTLNFRGVIAKSTKVLVTEQVANNEIEIDVSATLIAAEIDIGDLNDATHAADHITAGSDEIDGDHLDIDFTPANYVPSISPPEADDLDHLTAHLSGIDSFFFTKQNFDTDLTAIAGLTTFGLIARTGTGSMATRTITAGSAKIDVTDGDGVSGNPTIDADESEFDANNFAATWIGTSLPGSPATDDKFIAKDDHNDYFFDGTHWVSDTIMVESWGLNADASAGGSNMFKGGVLHNGTTKGVTFPFDVKVFEFGFTCTTAGGAGQNVAVFDNGTSVASFNVGNTRQNAGSFSSPPVITAGRSMRPFLTGGTCVQTCVTLYFRKVGA